MHHEASRRTREQQAVSISRWSLAANLVLALFKLAAGLLARSSAMVSDAVHSASDMGTTLVVIASVRLSSRKADRDHEYGHERLEAVAAIVMSFALVLTGAGIGWQGIRELLAPAEGAAAPGALALAAALVSILVKEAMYRVTMRTAKRLNSTALAADAHHHRSDALSSVGSLAGIAASRLGWAWGDPLACLLISLLVIKAGIDTFRGAADQLTDKACEPELEARMRRSIEGLPGVLGVDLLQTRRFASRIYADVEIAADGSQTLNAAHAIAEQVHDRIEREFPDVKHCMVHVNPI